jgi:hypothetical protein
MNLIALYPAADCLEIVGTDFGTAVTRKADNNNLVGT